MYQGRLFTHDTFPLNLSLDQGKYVLFMVVNGSKQDELRRVIVVM